jgi:transposase
LTEQAREWASVEVGKKGRSTAEVARELGVGWATVWRTVVEKGRGRIDDPARLDGVQGFGVDETAFLATTATSSMEYVTGIVDLARPPSRMSAQLTGMAGRLAERDLPPGPGVTRA